MAGLLDGITVLDLAGVGPAARASGWLADYGADVIKVGAAGARADEQIVPPAHAYSAGRGTRRIRIDLKAAAGRDVFLRLAERADVVLESFRPGVVSRLGIGYDDVKSCNPRIVYCSTSGYGQNGPRAQWAGHDLNYLAAGGYLANTERASGGKPPLPGSTVGDSAAGGMHAVVAILAALVGRARTGEGCYLDVSVADGVLALMALQIDAFLAAGIDAGPGSAPMQGRFACYDTYRTGDGEWLAVAAIESRFWANLCKLLGLEALVEKQYDADAQDGIRAELTRVFATKTRAQWTDALAGADTCVSPVLSPGEAAAAAPLATAIHPSSGEFRQLAPVLAGTVAEERYVVTDAATTETDAVLAAAGYASEEIATLRANGVVQ